MTTSLRYILVFAIAWTARPACAQIQSEAFTEPFRTVDLSPAEPGVLAKIFVKEGEAVRVDDRVAALDTSVLEVSLKIARQAMQSRGKLMAARAEYELKKERLEKLTALKSQGYANPDELKRAATDVEVADANRLAAEEQLAVDTLQLEKVQAELSLRTLRSPINGVVSKIHYEEREFISTPNSAVVTVVQLDPLRVVFPLDTSAALQFRRDQSVTIRFPESNRQVQGRIELVSPITDAESGMVRVKVLIENADGRYRSGVRAILDSSAPSTEISGRTP